MRYRIKSIREKKGLSQEELAQKANISRTTLSTLEQDKEVVTNTDTLKKIATALGVKVSDIFFEQ